MSHVRGLTPVMSLGDVPHLPGLSQSASVQALVDLLRTGLVWPCPGSDPGQGPKGRR